MWPLIKSHGWIMFYAILLSALLGALSSYLDLICAEDCAGRMQERQIL